MSIKRLVKLSIKSVKSAKLHIEDWGVYSLYSKSFKKNLRSNRLPNKKVEGEDEYVRRWSVFNGKAERYSYRLFSHYCGKTVDIVPEDIGVQFLERVLNPVRYRSTYKDKNLYSSYLKQDYLPQTILRRMGGGKLLNNDYLPIDTTPDFNIPTDCERVILKPTIDTSLGRGVMLFERVDDDWISKKDNVKLSYDFLYAYGDNFIIQRAVEQHPYISQFGNTSVNTLRVGVYRSVSDESVNVIGAIMRIGRVGCITDNGLDDGRFVGVDMNTGAVGKYLCNYKGEKIDEWNGVNVANNNFTIPNWDKVRALAEYVGRQNHHCRLLAMDISLDKDGNAKLIEYNVAGYSYWYFMLTGKSPFGSFTDEIIEHCLAHKNERECYFIK